MGKAVYYVSVIRKGMEREYHALCAAGSLPGDYGSEVGFLEPIRASNRREAFVLVRRRYPDHVVLDDAVKESPNTGRVGSNDATSPRSPQGWRTADG
jgi:hypothetical protein